MSDESMTLLLGQPEGASYREDTASLYGRTIAALFAEKVREDGLDGRRGVVVDDEVLPYDTNAAEVRALLWSLYFHARGDLWRALGHYDAVDDGRARYPVALADGFVDNSAAVVAALAGGTSLPRVSPGSSHASRAREPCLRLRRAIDAGWRSRHRPRAAPSWACAFPSNSTGCWGAIPALRWAWISAGRWRWPSTPGTSMRPAPTRAGSDKPRHRAKPRPRVHARARRVHGARPRSQPAPATGTTSAPLVAVPHLQSSSPSGHPDPAGERPPTQPSADTTAVPPAAPHHDGSRPDGRLSMRQVVVTAAVAAAVALVVQNIKE